MKFIVAVKVQYGIGTRSGYLTAYGTQWSYRQAEAQAFPDDAAAWHAVHKSTLYLDGDLLDWEIVPAPGQLAAQLALGSARDAEVPTEPRGLFGDPCDIANVNG